MINDFFALVGKSAGTLWNSPVHCDGMWNVGQIGIVRVWINTRPRDRGIRAAHIVRATKRRNFQYLNYYCISTWYAQKTQDMWRYLIFVYKFTDKGKSGRSMQLLASRGTADQLYIQARSLYYPKRVTCFGFLPHLSSGTGITIEGKINTWCTKY